MPSDPQPWTDTDVQLVTAAINDASGYAHDDDASVWAPYVLTALAEAGRLAPPAAPVIAGWPVPSVFMQWKGTDVCLDFHCTCGAHGHLHGDFVYGVRCSSCSRVFVMPHTLALTEGEPDSDIVKDVETRPWVEADEDGTG